MTRGSRTAASQTCLTNPTATAYHTAFAGKVAALLRAGIAPWQTPWTPGRVRVPVTRITTRRTPAPPSTKE